MRKTYLSILNESIAPSTTMRDVSAFMRCRSCSIPSTVQVDEDWPTTIIVGHFTSNMKSSGSPRLPSTQKSGNPKHNSDVTGSKYATCGTRTNSYAFLYVVLKMALNYLSGYQRALLQTGKNDWTAGAAYFQFLHLLYRSSNDGFNKYG